MTDAPFRPFETHLDRNRTLGLLRKAMTGADDGEIFLERSRAETLLFDDGRIRTASHDASEGFGLRAVRGEVAGYAHSTDISEEALLRAVDTARLAVGNGRGKLADAPPPTLYFDLGEISVQEFRPTRNETTEVRFSIQMRLKPEVTAAQSAALEHWKHRLRDQAIIAARLASSADLAEPGLDRLQASILRRMKRILPTLAVERLYFTDFAAGTP